MLLLLYFDLPMYSSYQCLDLHSSLTKKIFSQLPSEAQKPVTALSQVRGYFSAPPPHVSNGMCFLAVLWVQSIFDQLTIGCVSKTLA